MRSASLPLAITILLCAASTSVAAANTPASVPKPAPVQTVPAQTNPAKTAPVAPVANGSDLGQSADLATLANMSGGTDVSNRIDMHGDVSNNSADHVVTGDNTIASGSFSGSVGLPMVIQNSGNNVLIQNATIVSVQFQP